MVDLQLCICANIINFFSCKGKNNQYCLANVIIQKMEINLYTLGTRDVNTKRKPHF